MSLSLVMGDGAELVASMGGRGNLWDPTPETRIGRLATQCWSSAMLNSAAIDMPDRNRVQVHALETSDVDSPSIEGLHAFK